MASGKSWGVGLYPQGKQCYLSQPSSCGSSIVQQGPGPREVVQLPCWHLSPNTGSRACLGGTLTHLPTGTGCSTSHLSRPSSPRWWLQNPGAPEPTCFSSREALSTAGSRHLLCVIAAICLLRVSDISDHPEATRGPPETHLICRQVGATTKNLLAAGLQWLLVKGKGQLFWFRFDK
jgi:hypothetical protein